jgi:uncharacterized membrane protein YoaK (UPF0700 family)
VPARSHLRDGLLITLTAGAGAVDAVTYLGLGKVFTANMTGNIVLLGIAVGRGAHVEEVRAAVSLAAYVLGVFLGGRAMTLWPRPERWPTGMTVVLAADALAQAGLWTGWLLAHAHPGTELTAGLVATSAVAMGLQAGAARALGVSGVTTTYVTGTLTGLVGQVAEAEGSAGDRLRRGFVLVALFGGAALAVLLMLHARHWAPGLPLLLTLLVFAGGLLFARGARAERA